MADMHTGSVPDLSERLVAGTTVVTLRGEIDLLVAQALTERLDALTAGPCPDLVLDLSHMAFIDCAGLSVLCRARNRVTARAGRLRLVSDDPGFLRLLRTVHLTSAFETQPHLPDALTAAPAPTAATAG
ncbi:STAS domain-containing protein [Streptomyces sp. NPDC018693]|uniref:STAS domain-containing protein n=1 Tax=unclassified Streptomyces TaxID=2593676 RepID=UPI0037A2C673